MKRIGRRIVGRITAGLIAALACGSVIACSGLSEEDAQATEDQVRIRDDAGLSPGATAGSGGVFLFGGWAENGRLSDTWEWDGTNWEEKKIDNPPLGLAGLAEHAMAYDDRGKVVLFGGVGDVGISGMFEWDGTTWAATTPRSVPENRFAHAMAYDSSRKALVLFGGAGKNGPLSDTWEWKGNTWTAKTTGEALTGRDKHAMAYDSVRKKVVLFGGESNFSAVADTWEWDGKNWKNMTPKTFPPDRYCHAMVYDSNRKVVVLFGGFDHRRGQVRDSEGRVIRKDKTHLSDTWEWDGTDWKRMEPKGKSPIGRHSHAMAYDSVRKKVVLFGGYRYGDLFDTWEWDGEKWEQKEPTNTPYARHLHAMVGR